MFYSSFTSILHKGQWLQKEQDDEESGLLYCQLLVLLEILIKYISM